MDNKMISFPIGDIDLMRKLFIAADDRVIFFEYKYSQSLLTINDVMEAFKGNDFTGYELRYWPDTEYMQLIERYKVGDNSWGDVSIAYASEKGAIKDLFIKLLPILTDAELYIGGKKA